jgi:hypothetical protein
MRHLFRRPRMAIRVYRRPVYQGQGGVPPLAGQPFVPIYENIFVLLDTPLLEINKADLIFLRLLRIDPFIEPSPSSGR